MDFDRPDVAQPENSSQTWKVVKIAFSSRLVILALQVIFDITIPDHHPEVFHTPGYQNQTILDEVITYFLGGSRCWDSQYFLHVAQYGYTYENTLAFFPLYPLLVYLLGTSLQTFLQSWMSLHTILLLSGIILNVIFFMGAAAALYHLSCTVLADRHLAQKAVILFCISPASIFFSSCYSESLFCMLSFLGMLFTENQKPFLGAVMFGLCSGTRSNGLICAGFIFHSQIRQLIRELTYWNGVLTLQLQTSLLWIVNTSLYLVICLAPFVLFQLYTFILYCLPLQMPLETSSKVTDYSETKGLLMPGDEVPPWCNSYIPISYSYVQKYYWEVGFLNYYQLKQIPNFILAFPAASIIITFSAKYFVRNSSVCASLGLLSKIDKSANLLDNSRCFVYVVHLSLLTLFCVLCIHVQVTTRIIASSSPLLYWIAAWMTSQEPRPSEEQSNKCSKPLLCKSLPVFHPGRLLEAQGKLPMLILLYFYLYCILGIVLHSNFLPWT